MLGAKVLAASSDVIPLAVVELVVIKRVVLVDDVDVVVAALCSKPGTVLASTTSGAVVLEVEVMLLVVNACIVLVVDVADVDRKARVVLTFVVEVVVEEAVVVASTQGHTRLNGNPACVVPHARAFEPIQ